MAFKVLCCAMLCCAVLWCCCQVGFGEDVDLLLSNRSAGLWTAFEGVGRHVAYYIDNVPM
jgi:hypothetical protein